jgi:hypothetical protein
LAVPGTVQDSNWLLNNTVLGGSGIGGNLGYQIPSQLLLTALRDEAVLPGFAIANVGYYDQPDSSDFTIDGESYDLTFGGSNLYACEFQAEDKTDYSVAWYSDASYPIPGSCSPVTITVEFST